MELKMAIVITKEDYKQCALILNLWWFSSLIFMWQVDKCFLIFSLPWGLCTANIAYFWALTFKARLDKALKKIWTKSFFFVKYHDTQRWKPVQKSQVLFISKDGDYDTTSDTFYFNPNYFNFFRNSFVNCMKFTALHKREI